MSEKLEKEQKLCLAQALAGMSDPERVEFVTSMLILAMEKQLNREPTVLGGPDNVKKIIDSQKERWTKQATNLVYWGRETPPLLHSWRY